VERIVQKLYCGAMKATLSSMLSSWRRVLLGAAAALAATAVLAEPVTGAPLFAAPLVDLNDKPATLAAWKGKPIIVNFWARWCTPCRKEIPEFIKARARHKGSPVEVIGIALEEQGGPVRDFAKAYDMDYPIVLVRDNGMELMARLGNGALALPFTLAVDRAGKIAYTKLGPMTAADLDAAFAAAAR
jgi:thiol-disulfide isomerase/thioredoxin